MGVDDYFHSGLVLGLGLSSSSNQQTKRPSSSSKPTNEPSLTLSLSGGSESFDHQARKVDFEFQSNPAPGLLYGPQPDYSAGSSSLSVKRERSDLCCEDQERVSLSSCRAAASDDDDDGSNGRKKLRLTKAQSALLEDSFTHHSTLNPKQKQELARELKLRPRQVEVWFQNRRARTKLKQTEVDCEFLKKCCETLTDENRRLQKELQALKLAKPLYMQLPAAATLNICPSCDRLAAAGGSDNNNNNLPTAPANKAATATFNNHHLYNPFITNHPSAAC